MEPENPPPPPEAVLIRTAREAAGLTAAAAAKLTADPAGKQAVSATYWRDIERGHGGRRGQQAPTRASAKTLAVMARVTGVTPDQLDNTEREDAARVLREVQRREEGTRTPVQERVPAPVPGDDPKGAFLDLMLRAAARDVPLLQAAARALVPQPPLPGAENSERDAYLYVMAWADLRDVELLQILGRALDPEGEPMPWKQKRAIAEQYLAEFAERENGNAGTA